MKSLANLFSMGRALLASTTLAVFGLAAAQVSYAGCGQYDAPSKIPVSWRSLADTDSVRFIRADFRHAAAEGNAVDWQERGRPAITGLWYFKYLSKGNTALGIPDGAPLDAGNTLWFADGNEMTSSSMRAPQSGSICLGTWEKTGDRTYELNHIGLSWDPVKNEFAGPAFIKQFVTLENGGDQYSGVVTITQYGPDGKTVEVELKGIITATRVTVNTTSQLP